MTIDPRAQVRRNRYYHAVRPYVEADPRSYRERYARGIQVQCDIARATLKASNVTILRRRVGPSGESM